MYYKSSGHWTLIFIHGLTIDGRKVQNNFILPMIQTWPIGIVSSFWVRDNSVCRIELDRFFFCRLCMKFWEIEFYPLGNVDKNHRIQLLQESLRPQKLDWILFYWKCKASSNKIAQFTSVLQMIYCGKNILILIKDKVSSPLLIYGSITTSSSRALIIWMSFSNLLIFISDPFHNSLFCAERCQ